MTYRAQVFACLTACSFLCSPAASVAASASDNVQLTAMVDKPCPTTDPIDENTRAFIRMLVEPGEEFVAPPPSETPVAPQDWANVCRYYHDNKAVQQRPDIVFIGDSLTDFWQYADPSLFNRQRLNRGISGQTSGQILLRFQGDVVNLKPRVVHILAGGNDIAGNSGQTSLELFQNNIIAMTDLAQANDIEVVLGAIPPIEGVWWAPLIKPAAKIAEVNEWLQQFAQENDFVFVNYHAVFDEVGGMLPAYANDGVHPNREGYQLMRARLDEVLEEEPLGRGSESR